ncbi:hypothetical protein PJ15_3446 [Acinetobacter sp. neg1]|nr:hypothetical protein PJ15_3446 [Acinetobacter sp. neg1]
MVSLGWPLSLFIQFGHHQIKIIEYSDNSLFFKIFFPS